jgi:hypothetical protein
MITLDPKMKNFSGWVRKQLMAEMAEGAKSKEFNYESFCDQCNVWYAHTSEYDAKFHSCQYCQRLCSYMTTEVTE